MPDITPERCASSLRPAAYRRSRHRAQQLCLENELALLVLLAGLIGLVVLPADRLLTLATVDVADNVAAGGHVALVGLRLGDVDDAVEQVRLAVLAAEVLCMSATPGEVFA